VEGNAISPHLTEIAHSSLIFPYNNDRALTTYRTIARIMELTTANTTVDQLCGGFLHDQDKLLVV
jgi:hypothetical protein